MTDVSEKKKALYGRRDTLAARISDNKALEKDQILDRLDLARNWMHEAMGHGVFRKAEEYFHLNTEEILTTNFDTIEKAINDVDEESGDPETEHEGKTQLFEVEDLTVGPALPYVYKANAITWGFFLLMTVLASYGVSIDHHGMALPPQNVFLLVFILLFVIVAVLTLVYEALAALYVLPTQLIYVDKLAAISFKQWNFVMLLISFILHSDVYTTSLFVGRVAASVSACNELELHWQRSVNGSSLLKNVPFVNQASFWDLTKIAWLTMFLQLFYALAYSIPMSYDIGKKPLVFETPGVVKLSYPKYDIVDAIKNSAVYNTFLRTKAGHGRASAALAESGRMMSLNWHDDDYLQNAELQWGCVRVHQEMRRANVRFALFALQSILIPNLQITFLGVQKTVNQAAGQRGGADWLTTCSVILTVTCGLKYIVYEVRSCGYNWTCLKAAIDRHQKRAIAHDSNAEYFEAVKVYRMAQFSYYFNKVFCVFAIVAFILTGIKAFMSMTVCHSGQWNVSLWPPNGCVELNGVYILDKTCSYHLAAENMTA